MVMKMVSIVILRTRNKITRDGGTMLNDGASVPRVFVWLASDIVFDVTIPRGNNGSSRAPTRQSSKAFHKHQLEREKIEPGDSESISKEMLPKRCRNRLCEKSVAIVTGRGEDLITAEARFELCTAPSTCIYTRPAHSHVYIAASSVVRSR